MDSERATISILMDQNPICCSSLSHYENEKSDGVLVFRREAF